jgi:hypothetical protein
VVPAVVLWLIAASPRSLAGTVFLEWLVPAGSWGNPENWQQGVVPMASFGQGARITNGGVANVVDQVPAVEGLEVVDGDLRIRPQQQLNVTQQARIFSDGILTLENGGLSAASTVLQGGALRGAGMIDGTVVNAGRVAPGRPQQNPFGKIQIDGDYFQAPAGVLVLEVASFVSGEYDELIIGGQASLGGTLIVDLAAADAFPVGQPLALISAGSITGEFANVQFVNLSQPKCFAYTCVGSSFDITCVPLGDMNLDGIVDADDSPLFALALVDKPAYEEQICLETGMEIEAVKVGNVDQLGGFDFDDIAAFAGLANLSVAQVLADIDAARAGIPEPQSMLLALVLLTGVVGTRREPGRG